VWLNISAKGIIALILLEPDVNGGDSDGGDSDVGGGGVEELLLYCCCSIIESKSISKSKERDQTVVNAHM